MIPTVVWDVYEGNYAVPFSVIIREVSTPYLKKARKSTVHIVREQQSTVRLVICEHTDAQ